MLYQYFQHISFANPQCLFLLLLLPFMIYWSMRQKSRRQGHLIVSTTRNFGRRQSWKVVLRPVMLVCRLLAIACLAVAMARPQTRNDEELKSGEGVDIILCIDVSGSMLAQDFVPNRLEAAKQVAADFVDHRPTDRIGVVIFSGESFTIVPLTTDKTVLKSQIYNIQRGLLEDGTAIGDGLGTSVERLRDSKTKSRVVILLTDGVDQGGRIDPGSAKEIARSYGIKVYTIGVGTEGFAPVPVQTYMGQTTTQMQKVNIGEDLLQQIANETGGRYYRARDNKDLAMIYEEIDKLEKSKIEITMLRRYTERFYPFAWAALILLVLELLLRYTVFRKFP